MRRRGCSTWPAWSAWTTGSRSAPSRRPTRRIREKVLRALHRHAELDASGIEIAVGGGVRHAVRQRPRLQPAPHRRERGMVGPRRERGGGSDARGASAAATPAILTLPAAGGDEVRADRPRPAASPAPWTTPSSAARSRMAGEDEPVISMTRGSSPRRAAAPPAPARSSAACGGRAPGSPAAGRHRPGTPPPRHRS